MDYCKQCGKPLDDGAGYCAYCGAAVQGQNEYSGSDTNMPLTDKERRNPMALAGFFTALVGLASLFYGGLVAMIYGIVAICVSSVGWRQCVKRPQEGKWLGVLGLMIGCLDVCLNIAAYLQ